MEDVDKLANQLVFISLYKNEYDKCSELQCLSRNQCVELSNSGAKFFYEDNDNIMLDFKKLPQKNNFIVKKIGVVNYDSFVPKVNINKTSANYPFDSNIPSDYMTDIVNGKLGFTKYVVVAFDDSTNVNGI